MAIIQITLADNDLDGYPVVEMKRLDYGLEGGRTVAMAQAAFNVLDAECQAAKARLESAREEAIRIGLSRAWEADHDDELAVVG